MAQRPTTLLAALAVAVASPLHAAERCQLKQFAELPVTMAGTHPLVAGTVNGTDARFLADSGAFFSILTRDSAAKYKLREGPLPFGLEVNGIGGHVAAGVATVKDFTLTGLGAFRDVQFLVATENASDPNTDGVIGQNVLGRADTEYDLANGFIRLFHAEGCAGPRLAYWAAGAPVAEMTVEDTTPAQPQLVGKATLNGNRIRLVFDSGAYRSVLDARAAARAGIKLDRDQAAPAGLMYGLGARSVETWVARVGILDLGGEQIKNTQLLIGDFKEQLHGGAVLLLGADFFLSHRIYMAPKQHKIYFTYNGGRVFNLGAPSPLARADTGAGTGASADSGAETPKDAAGFRRRGTASTARRDFASAIADFDRAVELDPADAENYYQRGLAKLQNRQPVPAMVDFDATLHRKADYVPALMQRGILRLATRDEAGAGADFSQALKLTQNDPALKLRIAQSYLATGHYEDAISRLDEWIAENPADGRLAVALGQRCSSRAQLGKSLDLALQDCDAALKKDRNSQLLDGRALVWLRLGEFDKSMADFKASLALQPRNAGAQYGLGLAETRKGMLAEGDRDMQAATALAPRIAEQFKRMGVGP
jgi:tetratricopeptide (TPR) repeat protein/predicted aspartyl protease